MDAWKDALQSQYAAAIAMLENAMEACPDALWDDRSRRPEFWYLVYHTLFYLDLYLSPGLDGFAPPPPFTLDETDPAGVLPPRPYTKDELRAYLRHGREKARRVIAVLTDETARERWRYGTWLEGAAIEVLLDNLRHVQHHTAQLNLVLRQETGDAPRWVTRA